MNSIWQDLVFAVRVLRKSPGFTAVALLTLALGIGGNAAMFALTNAVLLRPLPYPKADRLLFLTMEDPSRGILGLNISFTRFSVLQQQSKSLESIGAAFIPWSSSVTIQGTPEQIPSAIATQSLFEVFGVSPAIGRSFLPEEDAPGGANVAMISDALWHNRFGGRADILGEAIPIDGRSVQIIGILPAHFEFPFVQPEPQIWLPRVMENSLFPADRVRSGAAFLNIFARMRSGETIQRAQAELDSLGPAYTKAFPNFADAQRYQVRATSLKESIVGPIRYSVLVLLAGVGFVLLIGCVNLASLLLARSTARRKEIAIRQALGASRGRLARQLLTEGLVLSFLGGLIGLFLAAQSPALLRLLPVGTLPRVQDVSMDARVICFALGLCALTGVAFGLAPLFTSSRIAIIEVLKEAARGSTGGGRAGKSRATLVICEVAIALILVNSAGLLIKSFGKLSEVNPGFDPHNVTSFSYSLPQATYPTRPEQSEFNRRFVEAVAAIPEVQSAAVNSYLPIGGGTRLASFCPEGAACLGAGKDPVAAVRHISPDYFNTMHISLLRGRFFDKHDNSNSRNVCIINDTLAGQFFPGQDPIGKRVTQTRGNIPMEVVGVVSSIRFSGLNAAYLPEWYMPQEQSPVPVSSMSLVVRSSGATQPLVTAVRSAMANLNSGIPLSNIQSMDQVISTSVAQPRLTAYLTTGFALLALLLAAIGMYGVMAQMVAQRRQELAIRIALGASARDVMALVTRQGLALVIAGVAIGFAGSLVVTRLFSAILYKISARDPITYCAAAIALVFVVLAACYLPARRASAVDPVVALREG
jgi:putative ABC transport system permease protein